MKQVHIDLDPETSIFVGANNSGKTSATHALQLFLADGASRERFSIHDFSSDCWLAFNDYPDKKAKDPDLKLPSMYIDLWFDVQAADLHRVIELLPSLDWNGTPIGVRIEYAPKNPDIFLHNYLEAKKIAEKNNKEGYQPWPQQVTDYLQKLLSNEYQLYYYVLDSTKFDRENQAEEGYYPLKLGDDNERPGNRIIRSIIKIDFLNAQRHLSDNNSSGRSEDLSKRLNRFYERNLQKREDDFEARKALARSEAELSSHLSEVFEPTIKSLNQLGYPGFGNPTLIIKAVLNHESIVSQTKLHYSLKSEVGTSMDLPDRYNGLGFKNLIYMVIELLDFHARWVDEEETRAPLHLVIIEEPEAHLHAQLQQVFIKQVWSLLKKQEPVDSEFKSQVVVTTHSPHIIYERGFLPIRYFSRCSDDNDRQISKVLNLSKFYDQSLEESRKFLERYMKLTHCDLFFADAAILVEGNVERLLLPLMISKCAPELHTSYLSILEVGGAFAYNFEKLINFLGLTTLIITDLDSVTADPSKGKEENVQVIDADPAKPEEIESASIAVEKEDQTDETSDANLQEASSAAPEENVEEEEDEDDDEVGTEDKPKKIRYGVACESDIEGAVTSNQTLIKWLPKLSNVKSLLEAGDTAKTQVKTPQCPAHVHVTYQKNIEITWENESKITSGRTLEEAFALSNLEWTQQIDQKDLGLRVITKKKKPPVGDLCKKLFTRVKGDYFSKTDFALGLMMKDTEDWNVPSYIDCGLKWLSERLSTDVQITANSDQESPAVVLEVTVESTCLTDASFANPTTDNNGQSK